VARLAKQRRSVGMKRAAPPRLRRAKPGAPARGKFYLTYPKKLVKEPLIYNMSRKFSLVFNVRSASVSEEIGIIALELDGAQDDIDAAVAWFREQGVTVEPIEKNVIE
jgi:ABC-type methionine transport system ATPase subunit